MRTLYTTTVTSSGGRDGHVRSADGTLDLAVALPKELGGSGRVATNPEQLFAAGYAACFENAVLHVARAMKLELKGSSVTATVGIGPREEGGFGLSVKLVVSLPGVDPFAAQRLIEEAHGKICPYSNATRGNIAVEVSLA